MADYYTNVCFVLEWPEVAMKKLQKLNCVISELADEYQAIEIPADMKAQLSGLYGSDVLQLAFQIEEEEGELFHSNISFRSLNNGVSITSDESANLSILNCMLLKVIEAFPEDHLVAQYEWALTCSKPMPGSFGGGAVRIDSEGIHYINTAIEMEKLNLRKQVQSLAEKYDVNAKEFSEFTQNLVGDIRPDQVVEIGARQQKLLHSGMQLAQAVNRLLA